MNQVTINTLGYLARNISYMPEFDGSKFCLLGFLNRIESLIPLINSLGNENKPIVLGYIYDKIVGKAKINLIRNGTVPSWTELRVILIRNHGERTPISELIDQLILTRCEATIEIFYQKINGLLCRINNALMLNSENNEEQVQSHHRLALKHFIENLPPLAKNLIGCKNPGTLDAAYSLLLEYNYLSLYSNNLQPNPIQNFNNGRNNNNGQRNNNNGQNNNNNGRNYNSYNNNGRNYNSYNNNGRNYNYNNNGRNNNNNNNNGRYYNDNNNGQNYNVNNNGRNNNNNNNNNTNNQNVINRSNNNNNGRNYYNNNNNNGYNYYNNNQSYNNNSNTNQSNLNNNNQSSYNNSLQSRRTNYSNQSNVNGGNHIEPMDVSMINNDQNFREPAENAYPI